MQSLTKKQRSVYYRRFGPGQLRWWLFILPPLGVTLVSIIVLFYKVVQGIMRCAGFHVFDERPCQHQLHGITGTSLAPETNYRRFRPIPGTSVPPPPPLFSWAGLSTATPSPPPWWWKTFGRLSRRTPPLPRSLQMLTLALGPAAAATATGPASS